MDYHSRRQSRQSLRLKGYDYTKPGAYFITLVTQDRRHLFGCIEAGIMHLNDAGHMIQQIWDEIPQYYAGVTVDTFVIMPNHIHGIIVLTGQNPTENLPPAPAADPRVCPVGLRQTRGSAATVSSGMTVSSGNAGISLSTVVQRYKSLTTRRYIEGVNELEWPAFRKRLWQRNYYERIIRNEIALERIRRYIEENPAQWKVR